MIVIRLIIFGYKRLQKKCVEKFKKQLYVKKNFFFENRANHERITANKATPDRPKICDMASHTG